jgi:hypothetical protein
MFTNITLKLEYMNGVFSLSTKTDSYSEYTLCFKIVADMNYEKYFFIAANSGKSINNYHYIKSVAASNLDKQVDSDEFYKE